MMMGYLLAIVIGVLIGAAGTALLLKARMREVWARKQLAEMTQDMEHQRLAELSQLAGGLAHEIRNPLSTMVLNINLLKEDFDDVSCNNKTDDLVRRSRLRLDTLLRESRRLNDILEDFMRFAANHQLECDLIDVHEVIDDLVDFFRPQADSNAIRLLVSDHNQPLVCNIDRKLFSQALLNLFINAQEAMPDGGEIIVRTSREDDQAVIEVADTGEGIEAERIEKVFQAYFSTKQRGTGLGLPTTKRIITEHGGRIRVHSEPQRGTSFTLHMPLARGSADTSENQAVSRKDTEEKDT